jgi:hypothetical protein
MLLLSQRQRICKQSRQARQAIRGETAAAKEMREAIEGRSITQAAFEGKNAAMTIIFDMPMPVAPQPKNGPVLTNRKEDER